MLIHNLGGGGGGGYNIGKDCQRMFHTFTKLLPEL